MLLDLPVSLCGKYLRPSRSDEVRHVVVAERRKSKLREDSENKESEEQPGSKNTQRCKIECRGAKMTACFVVVNKD